MVVFPQTGNRCIVTTGPGIVSNCGAVPAGVVGCVVLCLKEEGKKKRKWGGERQKELSNEIAQGVRCHWRKDKSSCIII